MTITPEKISALSLTCLFLQIRNGLPSGIHRWLAGAGLAITVDAALLTKAATVLFAEHPDRKGQGQLLVDQFVEIDLLAFKEREVEILQLQFLLTGISGLFIRPRIVKIKLPVDRDYHGLETAITGSCHLSFERPTNPDINSGPIDTPFDQRRDREREVIAAHIEPIRVILMLKTAPILGEPYQ
jgi:hypothetical protein